MADPLVRSISLEGGASELREMREQRAGESPAVTTDRAPAESQGTTDPAELPAGSVVAQDAIDRAQAADPSTSATRQPDVAGTADTTERATATPVARATAVPTATPAPAATPLPTPTTVPEPSPTAVANGQDTADTQEPAGTDPTAGTGGAGGSAPSGDPKDFSGQVLVDQQFIDDDLSNANFTGSDLAFSFFLGPELTLAGADFTGANLQNTFFDSVDVTGANFTDADLEQLIMYDSQFARAIWSNTTCPDGENSDDVGGTCDGHMLE